MNKFIIRVSCAMVAAVALTTAGSAMDAGQNDGIKRQINVAGKQRMLSQRMARASCFVSLGILPASQDLILTKARTAFDIALTGLRKGDQNLGLPPEHDPEVLARLDAVAKLWPAYRRSLIEAETDPAQLDEVARQSLPLLAAANDVVQALENTLLIQGALADLSRAINVAGRQRMLTQRAAKEFCLYAAGIDPERQRRALQATVGLFDRSLNGLLHGDAELGLIPAPDETVLMQFEHVGALWGPMRELFDRAIAGQDVTEEDLRQVAAHIDLVLKAADEAVWFYENL